MSTTNYLPNAYEEIDLLELFIKIYKFFKRRFLLILIVMVICVGLGVLANLLVFKPCYQTNMIFTSRSMTTSEIADITNSLNNLVKEENWEEIQKLTGLSKEISKDIKKLEAIPNREFQKNIEKDTRTDTTMTLILEITNNKNLYKIQQAIVNYFENLPYVQKNKKIYKENNERILAQIQKEIHHLDSLKKIVESSFYNKNSFILNAGAGISYEIMALKERENKVLKNLFFLEDIKVIKGFTRYQKPIKFSIRQTLGISALIGFIVGILWSLVIEFNKIIRQREQNTI